MPWNLFDIYLWIACIITTTLLMNLSMNINYQFYAFLHNKLKKVLTRPPLFKCFSVISYEKPWSSLFDSGQMFQVIKIDITFKILFRMNQNLKNENFISFPVVFSTMTLCIFETKISSVRHLIGSYAKRRLVTLVVSRNIIIASLVLLSFSSSSFYPV